MDKKGSRMATKKWQRKTEMYVVSFCWWRDDLTIWALLRQNQLKTVRHGKIMTSRSGWTQSGKSCKHGKRIRVTLTAIQVIKINYENKDLAIHNHYDVGTNFETITGHM